MRFDGAVLTKMDTDAGGAGLSIAYATGRPIVFAGTGQGYDDLMQFNPIGCSTNSSRIGRRNKKPGANPSPWPTCLPTKTPHAFFKWFRCFNAPRFSKWVLPDQAGQYHYNMAEAQKASKFSNVSTKNRWKPQRSRNPNASSGDQRLQMQFTQAPQRRRGATRGSCRATLFEKPSQNLRTARWRIFQLRTETRKNSGCLMSHRMLRCF